MEQHESRIPIPQTEAQRLRAALEAVVGESNPADLAGMRAMMAAHLKTLTDPGDRETCETSIAAIDALLADPIPDCVATVLMASRDAVLHGLDFKPLAPQCEATFRQLIPVGMDAEAVLIRTLAHVGDYCAAALDAAGIRDYEADFHAVADVFGIGSAARSRSGVVANARNAHRRSQCLAAVEREFFTRHVDAPSIGEDAESGEECLLNWGDEPAQYVARFRECLPTIATTNSLTGETRAPASGLRVKVADLAAKLARIANDRRTEGEHTRAAMWDSLARELRGVLADTSPATCEGELLAWLEKKRFGLVPEYEGPWDVIDYGTGDDAPLGGDNGKQSTVASGSTPREALRAAIAARTAADVSRGTNEAEGA